MYTDWGYKSNDVSRNKDQVKHIGKYHQNTDIWPSLYTYTVRKYNYRPFFMSFLLHQNCAARLTQVDWLAF